MLCASPSCPCSLIATSTSHSPSTHGGTAAGTPPDSKTRAVSLFPVMSARLIYRNVGPLQGAVLVLLKGWDHPIREVQIVSRSHNPTFA